MKKKFTPEQIKRKLTPLCSLRAPEKLAKREDGEGKQERYRTEFMRDRDRILYCKAFRRLAGKTQVYLSGLDDHRRTRLTHTLEVSQIARSIAGALKLDGDLVEAIALGHDLGHTPFGHAGERMLHEIMTPQPAHILGESCPLFQKDPGDPIAEELKPYLGFKHNLQSLKNAMHLEKNYGEYGLNLTNFALYGMQAHSSPKYKPGRIRNHDQLGYYDAFIRRGCMLTEDQPAWSLECFVVAEADEIAQRHHDVEDAIRGKLISRDEILKIIQTNFREFLRASDRKEIKSAQSDDVEVFIAKMSGILVNMYVTRLIRGSLDNINTYINAKNITQANFTRELQTADPAVMSKLIGYGTDEKGLRFCEKAKSFEKAITKRVLSSYDIQTADAKGQYIIRKLFQSYYATPQQLPNHSVYEFLMAFAPKEYTRKSIFELSQKMGIGEVRSKFSDIVNDPKQFDDRAKLLLMRVICDHIAGMTDSYAQKTYEQLYG